MKVLKHHMSVYQYTWTSLKLRAEKSMIAEVLTVIPCHTKFEVIDVDGLWLKVVYEGHIGFVFKQSVSVSELVEKSLQLNFQKEVI